MAKRLSSIFSLGSDYSDQSNDSRIRSSIHPARPLKEQGLAARKSTPDLRPSKSLHDLHNGHTSGLTPPFNPTIEDSDPFLQIPQFQRPPLPPASTSPGGSRPSSSRPESSDESFLQPPLLQPLPILPDSPNSSRHVSRNSKPGSRAPSRSPSHPSSRPTSPTKLTIESRKISKRRSWLPGKSRPESSDGGDGFQMQQAWIVTPQDKLPYDASPLASFLTVRHTLLFVSIVILC